MITTKSIQFKLMDLVNGQSLLRVSEDEIINSNSFEQIYVCVFSQNKSEAISFVNNAVMTAHHPGRLHFAIYCYNFDKNDVIDISNNINVITYYTSKYSDIALYKFFGSLYDDYEYVLKVNSDYSFFENWDDIFIGYYESSENKDIVLALELDKYPIQHINLSVYEYMYAVKLFNKDDNVTTIDFESCLSFFAKGNCMNAISKFNVQYDGSQHMINGLMFYMNRLLLVEHLFSNMILEE